MKEAQKRKSVGSPAELLKEIQVVESSNDDESVSVTSHSSEDEINIRNAKKGHENDNIQGLSEKALKYHHRL